MYTAEQAQQDEKKLLKKAAELDAAGKHVEAGLYRVQAGNCVSMVGRKKKHKPNLGPYSSENPIYCRHCGKPGNQWNPDEECTPSTEG